MANVAARDLERHTSRDISADDVVSEVVESKWT
jgi:hypothetical protein